MHTLPLSALLSHVLVAFYRDYADSADRLPSLPMLSNLLRVLDEGALPYRELPALGRVSTRVVRIATAHLQRMGWLIIVPRSNAAPKSVRLTGSGMTARHRGLAQRQITEDRWTLRYGPPHFRKMRAALENLVSGLDLELPHYPTSYGAGDISVTGGSHVPAQPGPPRIPAHGQDWPVVLRDSRNPPAGLPLPALLSQALTAFTIDYDEDVETQSGGLQGAATFFRFVGDDGLPLGRASQIGDVTGSGRSTLERHGLVIVDPGPGLRAARLVRLTDRGRRARDAYPSLAFEVERRWRTRFGTHLIDDLRRSLESLDADLGPDLPDFPDTNGWLRTPPA